VNEPVGECVNLAGKLLGVKCVSYSSLRFLSKTFFARINVWRVTVGVC